MSNDPGPRYVITDLDGTLVDILDEICNLFWSTFRIPVSAHGCTSYDVAASYWQEPEVQKIFSSYDALALFLRRFFERPDGYHDARPYFNWHQELQLALQHDVEVVLMTSRPPLFEVVRATEDWATRWGYGDCRLIFAQNYEGEKSEALEEFLNECVFDHAIETLSKVWFVDDNPRTCQSLIERSLGPFIYLPDRPWTREVLPDRILRDGTLGKILR